MGSGRGWGVPPDWIGSKLQYAYSPARVMSESGLLRKCSSETRKGEFMF